MKYLLHTVTSQPRTSYELTELQFGKLATALFPMRSRTAGSTASTGDSTAQFVMVEYTEVRDSKLTSVTLNTANIAGIEEIP
jgi:hypothetical protein